MNNKGFMLLETLIVSTILVGVLIFLYIQLSTIKNNYNNSFEYNTISGIYLASEISEFIGTNDSVYNSLVERLNKSQYGYVEISSVDISYNLLFSDSIISPSMQIEYILFTDDDENLNFFKNSLIKNDVAFGKTNKFKNFILKINSKKTKYKRLIIEFKDHTYVSVLIGYHGDIIAEHNSTEIYYLNDTYTSGVARPLNEVLDELHEELNN